MVVDGLADGVDILVDGELSANLVHPFEWTLNVATLAEGVHHVASRARSGTTTHLGSSFVLTIDRTAPSVASVTPAADSAHDPDREPLVVTFDEPLAPSSTATFVTSESQSAASQVFGTTTISGTTARFQRNRAWTEGGTVSFSVSGVAVDAAGNSRSYSVLQREFDTRTYWSDDHGVAGTSSLVALSGPSNYAVVAPRDGARPTLSARVGSRSFYSSSSPFTDGLTTVALGVGFASPTKLLIAARFGPSPTAGVVYTYDSEANEWSREVLSGELAAFFVAEDGHAFARVYVNNEPRVLHRAPGTPSFVPASDAFPVIAYDLGIWPADGGKLCWPVHETIDPDRARYVVRCARVSDGSASDPIVLWEGASGTTPSWAIATNPRGDAVLWSTGTIGRFDAATQTMDLFSSPASDVNAGIGASGHICAAFTEWDAATGAHRKIVTLAPSSSSFSSPVEPAGLQSSPAHIAVDGSGHCFFTVLRPSQYSSSYVVHDATSSGAFAEPFPLNVDRIRIIAGDANRAILLSSNIDPGRARGFQPF